MSGHARGGCGRTAEARKDQDRLRRLARALAEVLSPAHLMIGMPILISLRSVNPWWVGLAWSGVAAVGCGVIPYAVILHGVRRGALGDRHIYRREQRAGPLLVAAVSVVVTWGVLVAGAAPRPVVAVVAAAATGLAWVSALTCVARFKVSVHAGVAACAAVAIFWLDFGFLVDAAVLTLAALVGWSRHYTRSHTLPEVIAGILLGLLASGGVFVVVAG